MSTHESVPPGRLRAIGGSPDRSAGYQVCLLRTNRRRWSTRSRSLRPKNPPIADALGVGPDRDRTCDLGIKSPANVSNVSASVGAFCTPEPRAERTSTNAGRPRQPDGPHLRSRHALDHVHLLLRRVRVAVRKEIAGRNALVAQGGFLEFERRGRRAEVAVPARLQLRSLKRVGVSRSRTTAARRVGHTPS